METGGAARNPQSEKKQAMGSRSRWETGVQGDGFKSGDYVWYVRLPHPCETAMNSQSVSNTIAECTAHSFSTACSVQRLRHSSRDYT